LATNYSFPEVLLLSMTGALPTREASKLFNVVMISLGDNSLADAGTHAALLARITGARMASAASIVGIVAAEEGMLLARAYASLNEAGPRSGLLRPGTTQERGAVRALTSAAKSVAPRLSKVPAQLSLLGVHAALLGACGLQHEWQFVNVSMLARSTVALAEAYDRPPPSFTEYPMDQPAFRYRGK
jgi:hypothetical protein